MKLCGIMLLLLEGIFKITLKLLARSNMSFTPAMYVMSLHVITNNFGVKCGLRMFLWIAFHSSSVSTIYLESGIASPSQQLSFSCFPDQVIVSLNASFYFSLLCLLCFDCCVYYVLTAVSTMF